MKTEKKVNEKSNSSKIEDPDSDSSVYSELDEDQESSSDTEHDEDDNEENFSDNEKSQRNMASMDNEDIKLESRDNKPDEDEYQYDSSDEEDIRNTVGNIPMNWYDTYSHIGYDWEGEKIMKPQAEGEIDDFLKKIDDPNYWRTVKDKMTGQKIVLDDEDVTLIKRIQSGAYPTDATDLYPLYEDFFTYEVMKHPVSNRPEHKRSFIPSKIEKQKVAKLVHAIKMGWIKPRKPKDDKPKFYMLWDKDEAEISKRMQNYIPAPKMRLPGHEESYNPPPEYLMTEEEKEKWNEQDPEERKLNFIPQKYSSLRLVPSYSNFFRERFERCLDLYLCPRQRKMRVNVDPNDLIPKLPKPKDLQPFPTVQSLVYVGHTDMVRCICVEPAGQFIASGSDDKTVKVWEVLTGRCLHSFEIGAVVNSIAWHPDGALTLLLVAAGTHVYLINPGVGDKIVISNTDNFLRTLKQPEEQKVVKWIQPDQKQWSEGIRMIIEHPKDIKQVTYHAKGVYFASVMPNGLSKAIVIHRLSQAQSQVPFQKLKGKIQCVMFHPFRPIFFVVTQIYVRMYNLLKQELMKKLLTNCKWVSSIAVHPQGDNLIIGSYDSKLAWFDLDLSTKPYKMLRHHKKALRQVAYHKRYPLFASASDDGSIIICHGMVYSDLLQNPLIVPVKVLKGHQSKDGLSVLDCCFHPQQPWIFSSGADSTIRLYS